MPRQNHLRWVALAFSLHVAYSLHVGWHPGAPPSGLLLGRRRSRPPLLCDAIEEGPDQSALFASLKARREALEDDASLQSRRAELSQRQPELPLDGQHLEELLRELEGLRDWVSRDVAWAAMQRVREKRSLDAFISELQAEVSGLGDEIAEEIDEVEDELKARADDTAERRRTALEARAEELLSELEAAAPASFKNRGAETVPPQKSPFLPRGASVVVAGVGGPAGQALVATLVAAGYNVTRGTESVSPAAADPTLPASTSLRRELADADALVLVCKGASEGGVSPTFLTALARVLPARLRRVLVLGPRGVHRTLEVGFALRNALGGLDRQRAAEQAVATAAKSVGAVCSILHVEMAPPAARRPRQQTLAVVMREQAAASGRIAAGDALAGAVDAAVVAQAAREALCRTEAENTHFSLAAGGGCGWDDEFLKLVGPEIGRFAAAGVPAEWVRSWARNLTSSPDGPQGALLSPFVAVDLPTQAALAAAKVAAAELPAGVRVRFLASGVEFVEENEERRVKGDFDGAIDVYAEPGRVRVVRAEMEGVWRRMTDGSRKQVAPLVKVTSEARLLQKLEADLREEGWL